ncbi:MAG TPA: ATP-binding protein [Thermoanaerobaculia bacterium]|nr:ATP-binding protein [Thermoanaerobaculia bacterium]
MDPAYERLGLFYLGRPFDLEAGAPLPGHLLYDSRHLTTHGVCIGMTGSGKTGLAIAVVEEAAIDGVPVLAIDPKGDLGNLLLTFPELRPEDFAPWVDPAAAERQGIGRDELARREAEKWRRGLADWEQGPERIARLQAAADFALYTPGSTAGRPLAVLSSLAAPPETQRADAELLAERIATTAASLLDLVGKPAGALRGREGVLLSAILQACWTRGEDLDLAALVARVQSPPVTRIGVLELESFYPGRDRFALAMELNNLLASPRFASWLTGEPLDVERLLYTPQGRPRVAVCTLAHLEERERMFFVSLLLEQVLAWTRSRPGTSGLRALIYMDEVFGYLPPVGEPPSKRPLLTLLKQARAHGVGILLATQNPVDLDYKALSNIGTWMLGRLQTERDKQRLLDGLEGASPGTWSRAELDRTLSRLPQRVFLLHDVHDPQPVLFQTRWVMSYLRGPLSREEVRRLTAGDVSAPPPVPGGGPAAPAADAGAAPPAATEASELPHPPGDPGLGGPPVLPPAIPCRWAPVTPPADGATPFFRPLLLGEGAVSYSGRELAAPHRQEVALLAPPPEHGAAEWGSGEETPWRLADLPSAPPFAGSYADLPPAAAEPASYRRWHKELADFLYSQRRLRLLRSPTLGVVSRPGESEAELRLRLAEAAREARGERVEQLRQRYDRQLARLGGQVDRARDRAAVQRGQLQEARMQTAISFGATLLSALVGRKAVSRAALGRATTAARGVGRSRREASDVERAERDLAAGEARVQELEAELARELAAVDTSFRPELEPLEEVSAAPRRADVEVRGVTLVWVPQREGSEPRQ